MQKKTNKRDAFFKLMEMYLKSRSLHSYLIKKDLNGICTVPAWRDPFVWWYIRKERFFTVVLTVVLIAVLSCTLCAAITYTLCSSVLLSFGISLMLAAFHIVAINIFKDAMDNFGKTDVPSSISSLHQSAPFYYVDDIMTKQELEKLR